MRLLITVPWGERLGGSETMLQTLLEGAGEHEHEIELVFFQDGPWPAELAAAGLPVHVLAAGRLREVHRLAAAVLALARLLRRRRPDLIVNWIAKAQVYCAPAAMLAGMGGRIVWWQHELAGRHWLDRLATLLPARAVCCSSQAAATAQRQLWPHRPTFAVAPGVAPPRPSPEAERAASELALPAGVPVVGLVGRLQPWKGQDRLLRAHLRLREQGHALHTLIVGGDAHGLSTAYAASLPALAGELGLADQVTFTGQVPDPGPYIERMDVLVNASDPEPFGLVLLEGMARSVPVVAVDAGGPGEIVQDGVTGALARSGEPDALAQALVPLLEDAARRERLGRAGHERYLAEYTDAAMRQRLFERLQALAGPGP